MYNKTQKHDIYHAYIQKLVIYLPQKATIKLETMTTKEINNLTATETFNEINTTNSSIKKIEEWLKWNSDSCVVDDFRGSLAKRKVELTELQNRLDTLYESKC